MKKSKLLFVLAFTLGIFNALSFKDDLFVDPSYYNNDLDFCVLGRLQQSGCNTSSHIIPCTILGVSPAYRTQGDCMIQANQLFYE